VDSVEVVPAERAELLAESTFRPRWIDALGQRAAQARTIQQIARVCRGVVLSGAREHPIEQLADKIVELVR
jgi:hypothetical protein